MFEELRERASSWWNSEETVATRRQIGGAADSARQTMEDVADAPSGFVRRGADATIEGVRFFEDSVDEGTHALAGTVADVPVVGDAAEAYADVVTYSWQIPGGVVNGAADLTAAMSHAGTHPLDTARGLAGMAAHVPAMPGAMPGQVRTGLRAGLAGYDAVIDGEGSLSERLDAANQGMTAEFTATPEQQLQDDLDYWGRVGEAALDPYEESVNQGRLGEVPGRAMFDAAMLLLPGVGEAGVAGEVVEVAELGRLAEGGEIARVAEGAELARAAEGAEIARAAEGAEIARTAEGAEIGRAASAPRPPGSREPIVPPEPVDPVPQVPRSPTAEPPPIEPANSPRPTIPDDAGIRPTEPPGPRTTVPDDAGIRPTEPAPAEPARPTDVDMSDVTNRATDPAPEPWQRRTQPDEIRPTRPDDLVEQARRDARMAIDERARPTVPDDAGVRPTEPGPEPSASTRPTDVDMSDVTNRATEPAPEPWQRRTQPDEIRPTRPDDLVEQARRDARMARDGRAQNPAEPATERPSRPVAEETSPEPVAEALGTELDREIDNFAWRQEHPIQAGIVDADNAVGGRLREYTSRYHRYFNRSSPGLNPQTAGFVTESVISESQRLARWLRGGGGS